MRNMAGQAAGMNFLSQNKYRNDINNQFKTEYNEGASSNDKSNHKRVIDRSDNRQSFSKL